MAEGLGVPCCSSPTAKLCHATRHARCSSRAGAAAPVWRQMQRLRCPCSMATQGARERVHVPARCERAALRWPPAPGTPGSGRREGQEGGCEADQHVRLLPPAPAGAVRCGSAGETHGRKRMAWHGQWHGMVGGIRGTAWGNTAWHGLSMGMCTSCIGMVSGMSTTWSDMARAWHAGPRKCLSMPDMGTLSMPVCGANDRLHNKPGHGRGR